MPLLLVLEYVCLSNGYQARMLSNGDQVEVRNLRIINESMIADIKQFKLHLFVTGKSLCQYCYHYRNLQEKGNLSITRSETQGPNLF